MKKTLTVLGIVLLIAAFAYPVFGRGPGWGGGYHMMGDGYGGHMMGNWDRGPGYSGAYNRGNSNLTENQAKELDTLDRKFTDETTDLRNKLWTKSGELNVLMNSTNPDAVKAKALQSEISDLRSQMAEKRTEYELEARKINPDTRYGSGYGRGYGQGMRGGPMGGYGMGSGGYGQGACWN